MNWVALRRPCSVPAIPSPRKIICSAWVKVYLWRSWSLEKVFLNTERCTLCFVTCQTQQLLDFKFYRFWDKHFLSLKIMRTATLNSIPKRSTEPQLLGATLQNNVLRQPRNESSSQSPELFPDHLTRKEKSKICVASQICIKCDRICDNRRFYRW